MSTVASLRNLETLDLSKTAVTDVGVRAIVNLPELQQLHLVDTAITDKGLAEMKQLSKLWWLSVYSCDQITDTGLASIAEIPNLSLLDIILDTPKITGAGLQSLMRKFDGTLGIE